MRKCILVLLVMTLLLCACAKSGEAGLAVDLNLTQMSGTMVYAEVYNMLSAPENYVGKTVKVSGQFAIYQAADANGHPVPDIYYYVCLIEDGTGCCTQGIEFILKDQNYPEVGSSITVTGEFQTYMEGEQQYGHLMDAALG